MTISGSSVISLTVKVSWASGGSGWRRGADGQLLTTELTAQGEAQLAAIAAATPGGSIIRAEHGPIEGHRASTYGWWDYVLSIPAPRVIVVHDLDDPRGQGAQWGEVQANIHKALGCVGVVTDGSVRDLDEVRALGFQFCASHVSVSHANVHMVDFGIPVKVGGVWIKPGDLVHGDQHGVVTIPQEIAARIPEAIAKVEADERKIISLCQSAGFNVDKLKALYKEIRPGTY